MLLSAVWLGFSGFVNSAANLEQSKLSQAVIELERFKRSHEDNDHEEEEKGHEDHTAMLNAMFKGYDSTASPTHETSVPTRVAVNLCLISLDSISDGKMEYVIDARLTLIWNDRRLVTEECKEGKDCDDDFDMKSRIKDMWLPNLYFVNSKTVKSHEQPVANSMIFLVASGTVYYSKRLTLFMRCPMNLKLYPLDTQRCPLLICPYDLPKEELVLTWWGKGVTLIGETDEENSNFELIRPIRTNDTFLYYDGADVTGYFSCVNATFKLQRRNGYQLGFAFSVTFFLVIVSWIAFWLPMTAVPARITLGVTTLLTLLTSANHVRSSLPPITYVTAIDVWVGTCILFVFAALLQLPLAFLLSHIESEDNEEEEDKKYSFFVRHRFSKPMCRKCGLNVVPVKGYAKPKQKIQEVVQVDKWCRFLFPLVFLIFNIAYWSYYIPKSKVS